MVSTGSSQRETLRHWNHANKLMAPVPAERGTIIRRILFSRHVRPAVKIFPVSVMIKRLPSVPPFLSLSTFPLFPFSYYILARLQGYLPRQPPPSFLHLNARDTPYI